MDGRLDRRTLLAAAAAGLGAAACRSQDDAATPGDGTAPSTSTSAVPASSPPAMPEYRPDPAWPEGVLSGSPTPSSVVLWTRVSPEVGGDGVTVRAEVATDATFDTIVAATTRRARPEADHCVHLDIGGLAPSSWYFYRFVADGRTSPVGRTRTAPSPGDEVRSAHVAFFSCQRYTHGWYTSHAHLAGQRDLDLVISLGDYVYNDSSADGITVEGRLDPTAPATDRATFRKKYELYRSDPDLQAMHAAAPLVCVPDNHDGRDGPWEDTAFADGAMATFFERMPVRRDPDDPERVHGELQWGRLFHLWLLDLRRFRDRPPSGLVDTTSDPAALDPDRTTLGDEQRRWLLDGLASTDATWKLIGSSMMFAPARISDADDVATRASDPDRAPNAGAYINGSQWDGYQAERAALLRHLVDEEVTGTVVLAGDMHWFAAADVQLDTDDPASPHVLSEFVGGSVTSAAGERFSSDGGPVTPAILPVVRAANSQAIKFFDVDRHGYGDLRLTPEAADVEFVSPTTVATPDAPVETLASFHVEPGSPMEVTSGAQW